MLVLLLPIAFILCFLCLDTVSRAYRLTISRHNVLLITSLIWMVSLICITEGLSAISSVTSQSISAAWLVVCSGAVLLILRYRFSLRIPRFHQTAIGRQAGLILGMVLVLIAAIGVIGAIVPPNNPDGMSYHIPRILHWIQNKSVAYYPTDILRQVMFPPGAEYIGLHIMLLSKADALLYLIQWVSMAGCLFVVYLMTGLWTSDRLSRMIAVLFAATIPVGVLEANSVQNDFVSAFFMVTSLYFLSISLSKQKWYTFAAGIIALGVSGFVKSSGIVLTLPYALAVVYCLKTSKPIWKHPGTGISISLALLLIFLPYIRNYQLFGVFVPNLVHLPIYEGGMTIQATMIRILQGFIADFFTPLPFINWLVGFVYLGLYSLIKFEPQSFPSFFLNLQRTASFPNEDIARNTLHALLMYIGMWHIVASWRIYRDAARYAKSLLVGFILLILSIPFTEYNRRYELGLFVAVAPLVGVVVRRWHPRIIAILCTVLLVVAGVYVVWNERKPLIATSRSPFTIFTKSRTSLYFSFTQDKPFQTAVYAMADFIGKKQYKNIGLHIEEFILEYPIWISLQDRGMKNVRMEHVDVRNATARLARDPFTPDVVIACNDCYPGVGEFLQIYRAKYPVVFHVPEFTLFARY